MGEHEAGIAVAKGGDPAAALVPEPILKALRDDPVLHQLLGRMPASDPHGGRGVLVCSRVSFLGPSTRVDVSPAELALLKPRRPVRAADADLTLEEFSGVTMVTRPGHLVKIARVMPGSVLNRQTR